MRQVTGLISTYSSDEFGICSFLYELGGMVVMHDASGCNSTYTTHDEPRWYQMDSMIYISAISEMEAILGDDEKLIGDLTQTALALQPKFVCIVGAPIPYMIGTDLKAIARVVEKRTGIPCFGLEANGMHSYLSGISMAMELLVKKFCEKQEEKTENAVNILGATPLDFSINGSIESIKDWLKEEGFCLKACLAMGSSLEEIEEAAGASVNLVISGGAVTAAEYLKESFGIPYVLGVPYGEAYAGELAEQLRSAAQGKQRELRKVADGKEKKKKSLAIVGEAVMSQSLARAIELEHTDVRAQLLCPFEEEQGLLTKEDRYLPEEDDLMEALKDYDMVIADPMYQVICPLETEFVRLAHIAFSGRTYEKEIPNLIGRKLEKKGSNQSC